MRCPNLTNTGTLAITYLPMNLSSKLTKSIYTVVNVNFGTYFNTLFFGMF